MVLQQLSLALFSFLLVFAVNNSFSAKLQCTKIDSCSCDWGNGSMTTLKDLARQGGEPKYKDVVDRFHQGLVYSYNSCYAFTEDDCKDVAVCTKQVSLGQDSSYGTQDSAKFGIEEFGDGQPDTLTITYTVNNAGPAKNETRYKHKTVLITCGLFLPIYILSVGYIIIIAVAATVVLP